MSLFFARKHWPLAKLLSIIHIYLNLAATTGITSLVLYVIALSISFVSWLKSSRDVAVLVCGAALLCYCVQIFFSFSLCITAPLFWIFWGLLEQSLRQKKNARWCGRLCLVLSKFKYQCILDPAGWSKRRWCRQWSPERQQWILIRSHMLSG